MLNEIIEFERNDKKIKAMVFCYMPNGGPEMDDPYVKAYLIDGNTLLRNNIHLVKLNDPTLNVLTVDREFGEIMRMKYSGKDQNEVESA